MFYQEEYSVSADLFHMECKSDFEFPAHMHESFELIVAASGSLCVTVDGKRYTVGEGQAILVFPNQLHSFERTENSYHYLWIFSPKLVQAFKRPSEGRVPESNLFTPDRFYVENMISLDQSAGLMKIKGLLYSICAEFDESSEYSDSETGRNELLLGIFRFVQNNYPVSCTLDDLSRGLGFNYVYLSKYFRARTGISFTEYVCRHRLSEACYALTNTGDTVVKIAYECGFSSLRSFNRNFIRYIGMTPHEYRGKGLQNRKNSADES